MICCICGDKIEDIRRSCNAQPVKKGRCCFNCDDLVVTPHRLMDVGFDKKTALQIGKAILKAKKKYENT